jgi:hypothetical protein
MKQVAHRVDEHPLRLPPRERLEQGVRQKPDLTGPLRAGLRLLRQALERFADALTPERLNRASVIGRLMMPLYDVDDALAVTLTAKPVDGVAIASSTTTYYTVPSSGVAVAEILTITLVNTDSVARNVDVYLVENGGSAGVATKIWDDTLQPGERVTIDGPWFLAASGTLRAVAAVAAVVSLRAEVLEYTWCART